MRRIPLSAMMWLFVWCVPLQGQTFDGFDSTSLVAVEATPGSWGLKIVLLNVGQADAVLIITPNGDVCLVDSGRTNGAGNKIADYLQSQTLNSVGNLKTIDLLYTTHYDQDHIGGLPKLVQRGITIRKAMDQGLSGKRAAVTPNGNVSAYGKYVAAVGDINNDFIQNDNEEQFVRHKIHYGHIERIGLQDQVEIRCVAVRGDTEGSSHDLNLDPVAASSSFDENPGSIALLVRLGEFEFYTAGDQTDDDWKSKPSTEEAVLNSGAIEGGNDIDVLKVNHHGSDTSTSAAIAQQMLPEVAIVSTKYRGNDELPKQITIKQFQDNRCYVLITGDGLHPDTQQFTKSSATTEDDSFSVNEAAVFNDQGNVTILVSPDGTRYTVVGGSFARTFSADDQANQR